jgi:hypothetical protein
LTIDANGTGNVWTEHSNVVSGAVTRGAISWWHWERCFEFGLLNDTVGSESIHGTDGSGPCIAKVAQAGFVNLDIVEIASGSCKFPFTLFEGLAEFDCQGFTFWVVWAFANGWVFFLSSRSILAIWFFPKLSVRILIIIVVVEFVWEAVVLVRVCGWEVVG